MSDYKGHHSVLKDEITKVFFSETLGEESYLCDCTFGGGGHSFSLIEQNPNLKVIAFDQDPQAIDAGFESIKKRNMEKKVQLIQANFSQLGEKVEEMGLVGLIHGILFDLGVSSHHLGNASRGFSFQLEGPLDMRMAGHHLGHPTAAEVLNQKSEREIADIIYQYGEERNSRRIASEIVKFRSSTELKSTKQLENIVFRCYPKRARYGRIHPATKTFQALRLYVNQELEVLEPTLEAALRVLKKGGHIAAISFHSLEDRIIKHQFRKFSREGGGDVVTKRPMLPTAKEQEENKRSRSAKLRIFKKTSCNDLLP